jgi:uncharacterized protein (TIRG00374 family)
VLRSAVACGILAYLFTKVPIVDVGTVFGGAQPVYLVPALFITLVSQWIVAYRLKFVVNALGVRLTTWDLFVINAATRFYGLFLPGGNVTGIAVRFYKMSKSQKKYAEIAVALFLERVVATVALCFVGLAFWLIERPDRAVGAVFIMAGVLLGVLGLYALLMGHFQLSVPKRLRAKFTRMEGRALSKIRDAVLLARSLPRGTLLPLFGLSLLIHLVGVFSYLMIALSLGLSLSFVSLGWIRSGLILATMIPVSVSGLGLREVASLMLLANSEAEVAVAFSLLVFAVTILSVALLGGIFEAKRLLWMK